MTIEITKAQAIKLLERAVQEKGSDYILPEWRTQCSYEKDGKPSCLVGHALFYAGADIDLLETWDREIESLNQYDEPEALPEKTIRLDAGALKVFATAQSLQDRGVPWGMAVGEARRAE